MKFLLPGLLLYSDVAAQTSSARINIEVKDKSLKEVFSLIEQKSRLHFIYNEELVSPYKNIDIREKDIPVYTVLDKLLSKTNLRYIAQANKVIIEQKNPAKTVPAPDKSVTGKVLEITVNRPPGNISLNPGDVSNRIKSEIPDYP